MGSYPHYIWQERLNEWWWVQLPLRVSRLSATLGVTLSDGLYLIRWPMVSSVTPPLALLVGVVVGAVHPGDTFTRSLIVMALMIVVGLMSGQLGAWITVGYAIGDFFLHDHSSYRYSLLAALVRVRAPLILSYVLLGLVTMGLPLLAASSRLWIRSLRLPERFRMVVEGVVFALIAAALVYAWAIATPVLIRPIFTWQNSQPRAEDIAPLQTGARWLVGAAVITALARFVLEQRARNPRLQRVAEILSLAYPMVIGRSKRTALSPLLGTALGALGLTLLMAGLISGVVEGLVVFLFLAALLWVRQWLKHTPLPWLRFANRLPIVLRLAIGLSLSYYVSRPVVGTLWNTTQTFRPVLLATCLSIAILALLTVTPAPAESSTNISGIPYIPPG